MWYRLRKQQSVVVEGSLNPDDKGSRACQRVASAPVQIRDVMRGIDDRLSG